MKKKMILVAAPPACGKTYVSELIAKSIDHIVYLDKDDLGDLIRAAFSVCGKKVNMDGDFYINNLRSAEYSTMMDIAFSALRFENIVLVNAPFGKEVREVEYMWQLKQRANENGAQLFMIWVTASAEVCYERMKKRNSARDVEKLNDWDEYIRKINFKPPFEIEENMAVDKFVIFDNNSDITIKESLEKTLKLLEDKNND